MPERKKTRLPGWNYSEEGIYFLTICTKDRKSLLSRIVGCGILDAPYVERSDYGQIVEKSLCFLSKNNPDICLEKWVIMPNHVHILLSVHPDRNDSGASGMPRPTNGIVPRFVSSLKRYTNRICGVKLWQNGYHDHIIRDEDDFCRIWQYIDNNPAAWLEDKYFCE